MIDRETFRKQFLEHQWKRLIEDREFLLAWDAHNLDAAAARACELIYGNARNIKQARELRNAKIADETFY